MESKLKNIAKYTNPESDRHVQNPETRANCSLPGPAGPMSYQSSLSYACLLSDDDATVEHNGVELMDRKRVCCNLGLIWSFPSLGRTMKTNREMH